MCTTILLFRINYVFLCGYLTYFNWLFEPHQVSLACVDQMLGWLRRCILAETKRHRDNKVHSDEQCTDSHDQQELRFRLEFNPCLDASVVSLYVDPSIPCFVPPECINLILGGQQFNVENAQGQLVSVSKRETRGVDANAVTCSDASLFERFDDQPSSIRALETKQATKRGRDNGCDEENGSLKTVSHMVTSNRRTDGSSSNNLASTIQPLHDASEAVGLHRDKAARRTDGY